MSHTLDALQSAAKLQSGRRFALSCWLFGHEVDNHRFAATREKRCRCGQEILDERGETRVRHTVSCFLMGHHYVPMGERDGHREYVCNPCGHPLVFPLDADPYAAQSRFTKRVRYFCNLLGHRVHKVTDRHGGSEYACGCGHSFLIPNHDATVVKHPPICLVAGHFLHFVDRRDGHAEHRCRNCGHTFCFSGA